MSGAGAPSSAGALAGASLAAALAAIFYLGWTLAGLPFAPFDLFDWLVRALPGAVATFWIDSAVLVLRLSHAGSTASAAKSAEQALAIAALLAAGAAFGAAAFTALGFSDEPAVLPGGVLGTALGAGTVVVESGLRRLGAPMHLDAAWLVAVFLAWGLALGWVHDRWRGGAHPAGDAHRADAAHDARDVRGGGRRLDRRRFLLRVAWIAGAPSLLTAIWATASGRSRAAIGARWSDTHALPNADASVAPVPGTRLEFTPLEKHYRIDIDTRTPAIDAAGWRLRISGLVDRPLAFTLEELRREEPLHQFVTLACISNPLAGDLIGTTRWSGVSVQRLLAHAELQPGATHVKVRSADGFFELVSLDTILADARVMLAYAWDDVPLLAEHGFPLRIYVPDVYGMKQPKWIEEIELVNRWEPGYWVSRGWDRDGRMNGTAVIDTVRGESAGGIAHAGARGISRVEVSVDGGAWAGARLRDPLSDTTWVIWRAELPASPGMHSVSARCYDKEGRLQPPPFHTIRTRLPA